jgi:hypothetical protein
MFDASEGAMSVHDDTETLLGALGTAIDANKGLPSDSDEWLLDAEGLALKCLFHGRSTAQLNSETALPVAGANLLDVASMNVLARATIESFLTFHYVFAAPTESAAKEFRHLAWVLADLLERQGFAASEAVNQQKLADEQAQVLSLQQRLSDSQELQRMTPKQQKALLERGDWRQQSWKEIALSAGMSPLHAVQAYAYLSSFAHSGSLSVLQVRQAKTFSDRSFLAQGTLRLVNVALAFMARSYCGLFFRAGEALRAHATFAATVQHWVELGSHV